MLYVTSIIENVVDPIDCEWNEWQLGGCSVSCGGGTRIDTRTKAKVEAYGGTCDANGNQREVACNTEVCPRNT